MTEKTVFNVVRFKSDGPFIKRVRIDNWDVDYALSLIDDPKNYRYFWFEQVELECERADGRYTVRTQILNSSGKYFINAYIETYEDVVVTNKSLAKKMDNLGWTHIAKNIGNDKCWVERFDPNNDMIIGEF